MTDRPIFMTGAAGFIGSRLANRLLQQGHAVVGLDNFNDYYDPKLKRRNVAWALEQPQFTLIEADLRDADAMLELAKRYQPAAVAHLAAMAAVRYSVQHPLVYGQVNVQGTMNLLDAMRQVGQPRIVIASTGSVYGSSTPVPFVEDAAADRPLAPYPASKRAMEMMVHAYHHIWQLPTTILRFFNVYGPHGRPDMMPWHWTKQILAGETLSLYDAGKLKRDWTYVDDIVDGFVAALEADHDFEIINLGCGRPVANVDFIRVLERLLGKKAVTTDVPCPPSEPKITYADITKARRLLGYEPKVAVETGLARFIDWMRAEKLL